MGAAAAAAELRLVCACARLEVRFMLLDSSRNKVERPKTSSMLDFLISALLVGLWGECQAIIIAPAFSLELA